MSHKFEGPRAIRISTVIPTYNRREFLPRAIDSVLGQTDPPDEIIVVDDGSTDGTSRMLAQRYPTVKVIEQENGGVSAARNTGVEQACFEWLAFLDSDDAWLPRKLERQSAALSENEGILVCHTDDIWMRKGIRVNQGKRYQKAGGRIFRKCLPVCMISSSSVLIDREIFQRVGLFDPSLPAAEDYDLWLRICARYEVLYINEPLIVKYDGHPGQLSHQWGIDRYRIAALCKILDSAFLNVPDYTRALETLREKCAIYADGAAKRGKLREAELYEKIPGRYRELPERSGDDRKSNHG